MKARFIVVIALFAVPLTAQLPQARALIEESRYDEAKRLLLPLKKDAEAFYLLSRIAMLQADDEAATELCREAVRLQPANAEYHYCLGNAARSLVQHASIFKKPGLSDDVREHLGRALELDPNHLSARFAYMEYYLFAPGIAGGSEEKALQQAAELRKRDNLTGHRAYARIYKEQKKPDLARKEMVDAVHEEPKSASAHAALATYYVTEDKNYRAALEESEAAIRLDDAYMPAWFRLGQAAALSSSNLPRGEEALKKYLAYRPKEAEPTLLAAHYYLGGIFEKEGKKSEAQQSYAAALKLSPDSKTLHEAAKRVK